MRLPHFLYPLLHPLLSAPLLPHPHLLLPRHHLDAFPQRLFSIGLSSIIVIMLCNKIFYLGG